MTTSSNGRHRAPARHRTPMTSVGSAVTANATPAAKAGAVLAVSSGLVASFGMQASAAPTPQAPVANPSTGSANSAPAAPSAPAAVSFGEIGFTAKALPKPKPKPKPRVVKRASRSTERTSITSAVESIAAGQPGSVSFGLAVMRIAARYEGTPYRWGGTTPSGFDCSGYTSYVFAQVGIDLPRTSSAQRSATTRISRSEAKPGDLVFMPGHVGIYAGDGYMWDSPRAGKNVEKRKIWSSDATFGRVHG